MSLKRTVALVFIFVLIFANAAYGAGISNNQQTNKGEQNRSSVLKLQKQELDKIYKDTDKVRVVVELIDPPSIEEAEKQGKRYKDLSKSTKEKLHKDKLAKQKDVKAKISGKKVKAKYHENFTTVVNGFSAEVDYGSLSDISSVPEVKDVYVVNEYERPEEEPDMKYSKEIVQAQDAWRDYGFKGEGMVVGVIDTGIDPSHKDMVVSDGVDVGLEKNFVNEAIQSKNLPGKYYTEKVPYGYNYMDKNDTILDLGEGASMHGMHVGGTVGANGDEEDGGIKGVAPEAQLLALKVFGNDPNNPSTWGDIYVKAIDDAIALGADVINMSLGSTAGFVSPKDIEQEAVKRAVKNGVVVSISAGNSAHFGNGFANPLASNPDIGVSGSPGVSYESVQVASIENNFMDLDAASYAFNGVKAGQAAFLSAGSVHPNSLEQKTFELVDAGLGKPENFTGKDLTGKFALIKRGEISFVDKALNAQNAGAAGAIIYNNADGFISMATDARITIPQLFMLKNDGDKLQQELAKGTPVTVSFNGEKTKSVNPQAGKMSAFTSWGLTPNLDFKPEITAPGGQILSTLNNNEYGMMSGTSMAAPHVSGGAALVLQRVDEEFGLKRADRVNMAKNIMMNTSKLVQDKGTVQGMLGLENYYSPRRQGAGLMQLHSALSTPVVVTEAKTDEAKVALKEVGDTFTFSLKATNYSDSDVAYDVAANIQTDLSLFGELGYAPNELEAQTIEGATVTVNNGDSTVNVPANGSKTIKVSVDLAGAKVINQNASGMAPIDEVFPNGYFVEGFVSFKDQADVQPELHVPYVGFKGNWDKAPIIDGMKWDEKSFYGMSGVVAKAGEDFNYLGYNPADKKYNKDHVAISPNGDGVQDEVIPVLSFLRNAKSVEYNIINEKGKVLRTIRTEDQVRKNYFDGGRGAMYSLDAARGWEGKLNNRLVEDGLYYYEIKSVIDFKGAKAQSIKVPVFVDTKVPEVDADYHAGSKTVKIAADDTGIGVAYFDVLLDGTSVLANPLPGDATHYTFENAPANGSKLKVVAYDFAGNQQAEEVAVSDDSDVPNVYVTTPEALGTYNTNEVTVAGYITEKTGLNSFKINNKEVETVWNDEKKQYDFSTNLPLEDGVHEIAFSAEDTAGNHIEFLRTVIVDSTEASITLSGLPAKKYVKHNEKDPVVSVQVRDNFDQMRFYKDGSELFSQEFQQPYEMRAFNKTFKKIRLELEYGLNTFTFETLDLGGNRTTKVVEMYKLKKGENEPR